mgnify:CR=1 FL=1
MKLPDKIRVFGSDFSVHLVTQADLRGRNPKDPEITLCGDMCITERKIRILKTLNDEMKLSTLVHECLHAIWGLTGQNERLEMEHEESLTVAGEYGIMSMLPTLCKVLASTGDGFGNN